LPALAGGDIPEAVSMQFLMRRSVMKMKKQRRAISMVLTGAVIGLAAMASADVTGKVTFSGTVPDSESKPIDMSGQKECAACHPDPVYPGVVVVDDDTKGLKNVVVSLKLDPDKDPPGGEAAKKPPAEPVVIDQKGCLYEPHVTAVMTGQKVLFRNSDPCLHNIDTTGAANDENKFNKAMPPKCPDLPFVPKVAEMLKIKCDAHPWMNAWIAIIDSPYFAVTGDDGTFAIKNLPDGTYTIQAWHEKYGTKEAQVTVKDGKGTVDFKFTGEAEKK
jgi:plastocyanin